MKPLLTVPICKPSLEDVSEAIKALPQEVEAVEVWLDQLKASEQDPQKIEQACREWRNRSKRKLVVVCKEKEERGKFTGTAAEKRALLLAASRGGAHYIDIGLQAGKASIVRLMKDKPKAKVIISWHDFLQTPSWRKLQSLIKRMKALDADVIKIACMVETPEETDRLMELAMELKKERVPHIILGMGQLGVSTRVFAKHLGNLLNFVTLEDQTAPGQLSLDQMLQFEEVLGK